VPAVHRAPGPDRGYGQLRADEPCDARFEQREFEDKHGYPATEVPVAIDMVAVYVNKDNPIEGLSMQQVDAIFSATRACGYEGRTSIPGVMPA
jgi:hypothetical protein